MGVLLILMTIGGTITATVILAVGIFTKREWLIKFTLGGIALWFATYVVLLLGFSYLSTEKVLALNEPKKYCGFYLDCHMQTVVTAVRTAKTIGDATANGTFRIVNVRVFSDARNPLITLRLLDPYAVATDNNGAKYERILVAESRLPTSNIWLGGDIKGSQMIEKEIVFDVPDDAQGLKLLITEGYGIDKIIEAVLIGDEDSIFHKHNFFELNGQPETANSTDLR